MAAKREDKETAAERRRRREEEEEQERQEAELKKRAAAVAGARPGVGGQPPAGPAAASAEELLRRAKPLIEQVNGLYNQYVQGLEKFPPNALRKQLEQLVVQLQQAPLSAPADQFRVKAVQATYVTYKDKWDRLLMNIESGKIQIARRRT